MLLWTMCISLEILVITYLFPTLKYDIPVSYTHLTLPTSDLV